MLNPTHLKIDTSIPIAGPSRKSPSTGNSLRVEPIGNRLRSASNASSASSLSIVSPVSSSTNGSTSSLVLPGKTSFPARSAFASSSEGEQDMSEYVLAMHDYFPQTQNATCLSFRAGQVIRVLNRDSSGWWDGELEGRRGWFPSNYVNTDMDLEDEEDTRVPLHTHSHSNSASSAASWASSTSREYDHRHSRNSSASTSSDADSYYPPLMDPLAHGLSLLQSAVRAHRITHFQPSTACIISCVRSILSATDTLLRDAPILRRYPLLAQQRGQILGVLAELVNQSKKASDEYADAATQEMDIAKMLKMSGQVFAHVRQFLATAVQYGVDLPQRRQSASSLGGGSAGSRDENNANQVFDTPRRNSAFVRTPQSKGPRSRDRPGTPGSALRARSLGDLQSLRKVAVSSSPVPAVPSRTGTNPLEPQARDKTLRRAKPSTTHVSTASTSSFSSVESSLSPTRPVFLLQGPCNTTQVIEVLRATHDQYLSTIAAFIGHAHSHSRTSHASSTGHMYDLVREIVEMVCKLLTIVEAVLVHPDVPDARLGNLRAAKEGLYNVTSTLADSVRLLTLPLPPQITDEEEKQSLLRCATGALKAGADCVAAVKMCLTRSAGERPLVLNVPSIGEPGSEPFTPSRFSRPALEKSASLSMLTPRGPSQAEGDVTLHHLPNPPSLAIQEAFTSSGSDSSGSIVSKSSSGRSDDNLQTPDTSVLPPSPLITSHGIPETDVASLSSYARTDDGTTWEGSLRHQIMEDKLLPSVPESTESHELADPVGWMLSHDYPLDDVAYNGDGHLVGATLSVLVEKMTPHDSIVDPAFSAVFFLTFRLFSSPPELVEALIERYNLVPPEVITRPDMIQLWQQRKGIPVRLRVSNFIKMWAESYWRPGPDDVVLPALVKFTKEGLALMFPGPAQRILELLELRRQSIDMAVSPKGDRIRDPGMSINPPSAVAPAEIPRPTMTKTLLAALRAKNWEAIVITDFDTLELARQLTIMECNLYCAIQPEEIIESGQDGVKPPVNVRALSTLSTVITGWVAESILNEPDLKKRINLVKFFIKVADRCTSLHNYSTTRSMLAALDSSTISRLHQTWAGVPQKNKIQLEALRRLADHSRNYHEYRTKLRNTAPPAVPFLGLYLTDVTFCREGNPSHRASPINADKKLLNFNKYHKLARIVQDMQRFQVPYNLKIIPEVQTYLNVVFDDSKRNGDLQDLYRRSLLVEPKRAADAPPAPATMGGQLFSWAGRNQSQASTPS